MIFTKSTQIQSHNNRYGRFSRGFSINLLFLLWLLNVVACHVVFASDKEKNAGNERLDINQVLQKVIDSYPSLELTALKVEQAKSKVDQVRGQLDWRLQASAGVARNPGLFLGTMDTINGSANFSRRLENGDSIGLSGVLSRSDSEMSLSPTFPNPTYNSQVRVNYRKPLMREKGFPSLTQDLKNAELSIQLNKKIRLQAYESILTQVIGMFYSINATVRQVENIHQSLERTKRLKKFIEGRLNLGIAENKDMLQILAQIDSQNAQLQVLDTAMKQQFINLNRLLVNDWDATVKLELKRAAVEDKSFQDNFEKVKKHSPNLAMLDLQLQVAQNNLEKIRDLSKDNADLVLFVGAQSVSGDSTLGSVSENDGVGGISVEYKINQGDRAKASLRRAAQLYQDMALVEKKQTLQDLQYDVAELVSGIASVKEAVAAFEQSVASEKKKLEDAEKRYRRGRIDIDRVIGFENQLSAAELSLELQRIEIERRRVTLSVLNGDVWNNLKLPELQN